MALTLSRVENLQLAYGAQRGLLDGALSLSASSTFALADGTAAGQADSPFTAYSTFEAGEVDSYLMAAGLQDGYGRQLEFTAVKWLRIVADLNNTSDLVVGGATWPGMFGDPSDTLHIRPGAQMTWETTDAVGWPVVAGADELQITCTDPATYAIIIVGVSSQLSAPAFALHPAIIGTPRVGTPVACTSGDVSGNPALSYQWKRAGSPITGANQATYTPVAADLAKKLERVTLAANIAGSTQSTTVGVIVQGAALPGPAVLDFSDPLNSALAGH